MYKYNGKEGCGISVAPSVSEIPKVCASFFWGLNCQHCHAFINPSTKEFIGLFKNLLDKYPTLEIRETEVQINYPAFTAKLIPLYNLYSVPEACVQGDSCTTDDDGCSSGWYCHSGAKKCIKKSTPDNACGWGIPTLIIGNKVMIGDSLITEDAETIIQNYLSMGGVSCNCTTNTDCSSGEECKNNLCKKKV